jgi:hypothetical protein
MFEEILKMRGISISSHYFLVIKNFHTISIKFVHKKFPHFFETPQNKDHCHMSQKMSSWWHEVDAYTI